MSSESAPQNANDPSQDTACSPTALTLFPAGQLFRDASERAFNRFARELRDAYAPQDAAELLCVEQIILASWRIRKAARLEDEDEIDGTDWFRLLNAAERTIQRNSAELDRIRRRKAAAQKEPTGRGDRATPTRAPIDSTVNPNPTLAHPPRSPSFEVETTAPSDPMTGDAPRSELLDMAAELGLLERLRDEPAQDEIAPPDPAWDDDPDPAIELWGDEWDGEWDSEFDTTEEFCLDAEFDTDIDRDFNTAIETDIEPNLEWDWDPDAELWSADPFEDEPLADPDAEARAALDEAPSLPEDAEPWPWEDGTADTAPPAVSETDETATDPTNTTRDNLQQPPDHDDHDDAPYDDVTEMEWQSPPDDAPNDEVADLEWHSPPVFEPHEIPLVNWRERIALDVAVDPVWPVVLGKRIRVDDVVLWAAKGETIHELSRRFPSLNDMDFLACYACAAERMSGPFVEGRYPPELPVRRRESEESALKPEEPP